MAPAGPCLLRVIALCDPILFSVGYDSILKEHSAEVMGCHFYGQVTRDCDSVLLEDLPLLALIKQAALLQRPM